MSAFEQLVPFIQDYIYKNRWEELKEIQVASCDVIFNTDKNLLLSTPTASGKTEAAFLPAITEIYNHFPSSVGILYIAPLKALINDQFARIEYLLQEAYIPVTKWHGDASQSLKSKLLKNPQGVMQTTPESLEAMIMKRKQEVMRLFSDLRFIIIDEVHNFLGEDRGVQLTSILERIQKITNNIPRRIGLSATLGNVEIAKQWLNCGTNKECICPEIANERRKSQIMINHFYTNETDANDETWDMYFNSLYNLTKGKKSIIFSNSRRAAEVNINRLKLIAEKKKEPDLFFVHHGSISKELREYAEEQLRNAELPLVAGATVTLELGIDLGDLERIVQTGSPHSVSSLAQRLGRSGRRSGIPQMCFVFDEDYKKNSIIYYKTINWHFIKCIALIELYRERWIEPKRVDKYPFNILVHQTLSFLYSFGDIDDSLLAQRMLSEKSFEKIIQKDFKLLLNFMIKEKLLEKTQENKISIGEKGEWLANNYEFYSVFENPVEYSVREGSQEIGTLYETIPVGERFVLSGRTWEVLEIDKEKSNMYVKYTGGKSTVNWFSSGFVEEYTKVLQKMREILLSDEDYGYLHETAKIRLREIRSVIKESRALETNVFQISPNKYGIFHWLGTRASNALNYILRFKGLDILRDDYGLGWVVTLVGNTTEKDLLNVLDEIKNIEITPDELPLPTKLPKLGKYGEFVPYELALKQFIDKSLDIEEMKENLQVGVNTQGD
ncbi:MAG: DEAD/DEAH box helicase [Clostridiales bacterium]|jgi:ATP-dependent Lhr-like helicase|nr:DEAD/DEAH box helicase [Clostridiales bacterium]